MEWLKSVGAWLARSASTSETKAILFAALWALAAISIPSIPVTIPLDLSSVGMGAIILSPGALVAYALTRVGIKTFTDGQFPFQPSEKPKPEVP